MANLMRVLQDKMRMLREDAMAVASVVESAFKGEDEVSDEVLDKDLRQVFYDLQDEKILSLRREVEEHGGRDERHYYWRVADLEFRGMDSPTADLDEEERLYQRLGHRAWERRRPDGRR